MTFIYIVKKLASKWLENLVKSNIVKNLVVQETLSISSARQAFKTDHNCSFSTNDK